MKKDTKAISRNADLCGVLQEGIIYHDKDITIIDRLENFSMESVVMKADAYVIVLCLKGKGSFYMNDEPSTVSENDLFICRPNVILEEGMFSVDFECCGFIFSSEYLQRLNLMLSDNWNVRLYLEKYPIFSLLPREVETFMQYHELIRGKFIDPPHKYQKELINTILQAFSIEFYRVQERFAEQVPQLAFSSTENLFNNFINLLSAYSLRERKVAFYAEKLCISPKYLSAVCKLQSGQTASVLINQFTIKNVEFLFKQREKSIKEIANEMNFADLSFFGKYIKANLGMSPKQYRERMLDRKM